MATVTGLDIKELRVQVERNSLIKYFIDGFPMYNDEKLSKPGIDVMDIIYGLERLVRHVNKKGNIPDVRFQEEKPENDPKLFDLRDRNKPGGSVPG